MSRRHDPQHASSRSREPGKRMLVFTGQLIVERDRATCVLPQREIVIEAPGRLLAALARRFDGRTTLDKILQDLGRQWDARELGRLIDHLDAEGAVCDVRDLTDHWWNHVKNPLQVGLQADAAAATAALVHEAARRIRTAVPGVGYREVAATPLAALLRRRVSTRTYADRPVALETILSLLWAAYGAAPSQTVPNRTMPTRTVPSAGGAYPLQIDFVNLRPTGDLAAGIHRVSYLDDGRIALQTVGGETGAVFRAWIDPGILAHAQGIVVISGELGRTAARYGTRAALYVPLEAGHAAQNFLLAACEADVAAAEIGGFLEDRLVAALGHASGLTPLTSVVFGAMPTASDRDEAEAAPNIEFHWPELGAPAYTPPFFVAAARFRDDAMDWCWGRAPDPRLAYVKAVAEAQERLGCMLPTGLYQARYGELGAAIAPADIVAYSPAQYARPAFPYRPFDPAVVHPWKDGIDLHTGRSVAVLADHVYYGGDLEREHAYTSANTSGVAAYTTLEGAQERAVLELVERDAFMTAWLGRLERPTVDPASLPASLTNRVRALRDVGVDVTIKDHTLDLAPVLFVHARSMARGFTRVTAASAFDVEAALDSALGEAEATIAACLREETPRAIRPEQVVGPQDHADLYARRRYFRRADFLAEGSRTVALSSVGTGRPRNWPALLRLFAQRGQPVLWFDLAPPNASLAQGRVALMIGRAIVPGLLPICFGRDQEPVAAARFRGLAGDHGQPRDRNRSGKPLFPHPFP
jgi:ribosomal protein S12 methylthiotransferase accessory factor